MQTFYVEGFDRDTGKTRTERYRTTDAEAAIMVASRHAIVVGKIEPVTDIGGPPTAPQLKYAADLGILVPPDATCEEVSDMLDCRLHYDKPPSEEHFGYAEKLGIVFTSYVGKKRLFDLILLELQYKGAERLLCAWFAYRVGKDLTHGQSHPDVVPEGRIMLHAADKFSVDPKIIKSINRCEEGRALIWFGTWTAPDGEVHQGASRNTLAYKEISGFLKPYLQRPN